MGGAFYDWNVRIHAGKIIFLYFLSLFEVVVSGNHMKCYAWVTWWRSFSVAEGHHSLLSPFWLFFSPSKYRQARCVGNHRTSYMFIGSWSLLPFRVRLFSPPDIVSAWWPQAVSASLPQQVTSLQFLLWPYSLPVLPLGHRGIHFQANRQYGRCSGLALCEILMHFQAQGWALSVIFHASAPCCSSSVAGLKKVPFLSLCAFLWAFSKAV